jgi:hypothetical protein
MSNACSNPRPCNGSKQAQWVLAMTPLEFKTLETGLGERTLDLENHLPQAHRRLAVRLRRLLRVGLGPLRLPGVKCVRLTLLIA